MRIIKLTICKSKNPLKININKMLQIKLKAGFIILVISNLKWVYFINILKLKVKFRVSLNKITNK